MGWKLRGRLAGLLLLSISFISANAGYSVGPAQAGSGDTDINYRVDDTKLKAAQTEARNHLDQFFAFILEDAAVAPDEAGVKVAVPNGDGPDKVIWVSPVGKRGGQFVGLLASEPNANSGQHAGDVLVFDQSQVQDWYFHGSNGKMYGSYITRAMLDDLSTDAAARITALLSETPLPTNW